MALLSFVDSHPEPTQAQGGQRQPPYFNNGRDIPQEVGWFILLLGVGNLAGPLLLGRLFDTIGRKPMIITTYAIAGVLMLLTSIAFGAGWLSEWPLTMAWSVIFFFASAAASAAYLTVGEGFPLEIRAVAIAVFYAVGTLLGGLPGPPLLGWLIEEG